MPEPRNANPKSPRAQKRFAVKKVNWALCVLGCLGRCRMQIHISSPEATWVLHWYYMGTTCKISSLNQIWDLFHRFPRPHGSPPNHRSFATANAVRPREVFCWGSTSSAGRMEHLDSRKEMIGMTRQDCINLYLVFLAHTNHKTFHSYK